MFHLLVILFLMLAVEHLIRIEDHLTGRGRVLSNPYPFWKEILCGPPDQKASEWQGWWWRWIFWPAMAFMAVAVLRPWFWF